MVKYFLFFVAIATILSSCASVPMAPQEESTRAKEFHTPTEGKAGLFVYRSGNFGSALKKDIWIDGNCLGETAPNMFFYEEVDAGKEYKISTESEFSPNDLFLNVENGIIYFIRQYIKIGVFVGGANLELVDENEGRKAVKELEMAKKGLCSK